MVCKVAAEFGELAVIANEHRDASGIGVKDFDLIAADHAPVVFLAGGDVDFVLGLEGAIAATEKDDIVEALVLVKGHAAGDDVVFDGFLDEEVADFLGVGGESPDGGGISEVVVGGHEGGVDVFGEADEVRLIAAHGIDVELDVFVKDVDAGHAAHLELDHAEADNGLLAEEFDLGLVVDVVPLKQGGEGA